MDNRLSEAERKTFYRFMRTELGEKILGNIKELEQAHIAKAMLNVEKGKEYTHDCIVSATAIENVYQLLKPPKPEEDEKEKQHLTKPSTLKN